MQIQTLLSSPEQSRTRAYLFFFYLLCFAAFAYHIDAVPPYHADENFYVESSKNMLVSGDYVTPVYKQEKRFAKPILFYWMVTASYKLFGVNLFSARLVSALFGALSLPLTYALARRLFNHRVAVTSALILPGFYLHFQLARWAITDMALSFFILAALLFFIRGYQNESGREKNFYLSYVCMGIGFMIKGPPAILIPALTVGLHLLITRDRPMASQLRLTRGTLIFLALALPWFLAMWSLHGDDFKNHILGAEIKDRVVHGTALSFYFVGVLFRYYLPWALFVVSALGVHLGLAALSNQPASSLREKLTAAWRRIMEPEQRALLFCFLWIMGPLLLFTLFRIEHSRYMLPCSPAIAMILAHFFYQFEESGNDTSRALFKVPFLCSLAIYFLAGLLSALAILLFSHSFTVPLPLLILPFYMMLGVSILTFLYLRRRVQPVIYSLAVLQVLFLASMSGDALPYFNRYPMKAFAEKIVAAGTGNELVAMYQLGNHRPRLGILTAHQVILYSAPSEIQQFISGNKNFFIVMRESDWQETFQNEKLYPLATDQIWTRIRIDKEKLRQFWKEGPGDLKNLMENIVLLTDRNPDALGSSYSGNPPT